MSRKRKKHVRPNRRPRPVSPPAAPAPPVPAMPKVEVQRSGGWWRFEAMLCGVFLGLVGLLLFFWPTSAGLADAAKVAGRGYSAGSGGKSSSPPSGRGYSAGSGRPSPPSSGNRYSAGGSKPAPPSPPVKVPRPSPPPTYKPTPPPLPKPTPPPLPSGKTGATGTGRSYGKGAATNPSAGTKPTGSYDSDAGRAQRREESRTDYQKSQQPKPTSPPTRTAPTPPLSYPKPSPPSTYTRPPPLPRSTQPQPPPLPPPLPPPPTYSRGDAPKPNYTDPSGKPRSIDPNDVRVRELRKQLDAERWANRRLREQQAYGNFRPPTVTYSDPFHGLFHYWLLQQAAEERARWVYHHQSEMDRRRYAELLDKDRKLEERLREMEARRLPRDATFAPPGIDPDLVYSEAYAEAAYNPKKVEPPPPPRPSGQPQTRTTEASRAEQPPAVPPEPESRSDVPQSVPRPRSSMLLRLLTVAAVVALFGFVVWLVFVKRWGGDV